MASNSKSSGVAPLGIIPEFNGQTDDWAVYREILEEFFKANGVLDSNKVPVLISVIGAETYQILRDLCHPDSPKDKSYAQLCALLGKQFTPEIAIFRERTKFYRAEQKRGEDVKAWYARLKKLSIDCKFGEHLEQLLLDKFVCGLTPGPVKDRLCEENEKLTLKDAVDLAANRESALQDEHMVEEMIDLCLEDRTRCHRKRSHHHGHPKRHDHPRHGFEHFHRPGHRFGHGPQDRFPHHPVHYHGPMPPMGRHGMYGSPDFGRCFRGFGGMERGCPFKQYGHEKKHWGKRWHRHGRRSPSSSSSSSSNSSDSSSTDSSSSSSESVERQIERKRGHRHGKHGHRLGKFEHHGKHGHGKHCHGKRDHKKHGHGKRGGLKVPLNEKATFTENTEPEIIE